MCIFLLHRWTCSLKHCESLILNTDTQGCFFVKICGGRHATWVGLGMRRQTAQIFSEIAVLGGISCHRGFTICQVFVGFFGYKLFIWLIFFWDCFHSSCAVPKVNPLSTFLRLNIFESIELSETFWNEEGSLNGIWLHDCQCELHQAVCVLDLALGKGFDGSGGATGNAHGKPWSPSADRFESMDPSDRWTPYSYEVWDTKF